MQCGSIMIPALSYPKPISYVMTLDFFFFFEKKCRGALEDEIEYCDVKNKIKNTVVKSKKM